MTRLLAGLQTGVTGGLLMLVFYSTGSSLQRQHWWTVENLLGAAVYGQPAIWRGFGKATMAGAAVQILIAGASGILCGMVLGGRRDSLLVRTGCGLAWGIATYYCAYELLLPRVAPVIPLYTERMAPMVAHLLLGITLTRVQTVEAQISRELLDQPGRP